MLFINFFFFFTFLYFFFFFFFFQAEDGIRDTSVTGVQTCALPISVSPAPADRDRYFRVRWRQPPLSKRRLTPPHSKGHPRAQTPTRRGAKMTRSEERRVGKEWRYREGGGDEKKKREHRRRGVNIEG